MTVSTNALRALPLLVERLGGWMVSFGPDIRWHADSHCDTTRANSGPTGAFAPYAIYYAETCNVTADVGPYVIRRTSASRSERLATVKTYVRGTLTSDD